MKRSVHVCVPTLQQPGVENRANTEKFGLDAQKYRQLPPPNPCISEMAFSHRFQKVYTYPPLRNEILVLWTKNGENPENTRICSALACYECPREIWIPREIWRVLSLRILGKNKFFNLHRKRKKIPAPLAPNFNQLPCEPYDHFGSFGGEGGGFKSCRLWKPPVDWPSPHSIYITHWLRLLLSVANG